ncbi:MAG: hypothetical protein ABIM89_01425 [Mycobacteriales bacterium]
MSEHEAFFCDLSTMTPAEKDRLLRNAEELFAGADAVRDLEDGYSLGFENVSAEKLMQMADFVAFDRLCCAFLRHSIIADQHPGMTWLEFTGAPGAKAAIASEFLSLLPAGLTADIA